MMNNYRNAWALRIPYFKKDPYWTYFCIPLVRKTRNNKRKLSYLRHCDVFPSIEDVKNRLWIVASSWLTCRLEAALDGKCDYHHWSRALTLHDYRDIIRRTIAYQRSSPSAEVVDNN